MKIAALINIMFLFSCSLQPALGQNDGCVKDSLTNECVYQFVEEMPVYCNGTRKITTDILSIIEVDSVSDKELVTKVHLQFVINKKGKLVGARIKDKDIINYMERQILKAINSLDGIWSAGKLNGKKVSVLLTYTINID